MIDRWIKFSDIDFEAKLGAGVIPQGPLDRPGSPMDAAPFDAGIGIGRKKPPERRLDNVHDGPMDDPIRVIRKGGYKALLWLFNLEILVGGGVVRLIPQRNMQSEDICFPVLIMLIDPVLVFAFPRPLIGELQVLQGDDLFVQMAFSFQSFAVEESLPDI